MERAADPAVPTNEEIAADETVRVILEWMDADGVLHPGSEHTDIIPQPVFLDMAVPAGVRSRIHAGLIAGGMRIAADREGYHAIRIQWEPRNELTEGRSMSHRIIRSDLFFAWVDADREIQKTWQSSFFREDEIPTDLAGQVAGSWPPAAFQDTRQSGRRSFFRRIAEPAVITGAIAVTIYLLYNVRS
jgi:hypothetical protein